MWRAPVPSVPPGDEPSAGRDWHRRRSQTSGVDLAILVQNVGIHAGDHVDLGVSGIALGGLQVAVVQFQLIGGAGMTQGVKDHFGQPRLPPAASQTTSG